METEEIPRVSRRTFFKFLGLGALSLLVEKVLHNSKINDRVLVDYYLTMATGKVDDIDQIVSEIPTTLENKRIPEDNEWFRKADEIFKEGIEIYEGQRVDGDSLPVPYYEKPENYLTTNSVVTKLRSRLQVSPPSGSVRDRLFSLSAMGDDIFLNDVDTPYSNFITGSTSGISSYETLILQNPGMGFVNHLRELMRQQYGGSFDIWSTVSDNALTTDQRKVLVREFRNWYNSALEHIQSIRDISSEPLSTNRLFAYFLQRNNGDVLASAWDTAIWLKLSARNSIDGDLEFDPNYTKAKSLCESFKDEFSPHISANWVLNNVDEDDKILNYIGDPYRYPQWKDYMPANRAGGFYHAWNIISLSLCMSVSLVRRVVASHANPGEVEIDGETQHLSEYGREKSEADLLVAQRASQIARAAEVFAVN